MNGTGSWPRLRALGSASLARWAARLGYRHQTYCLVAWTTAVPAEVEAKLETCGFVLRDGTRADLDALEGETLYDDCATYRTWLAEGQQLLVAEDAGRVVSYVWLDLARRVDLDDLPEYEVAIGPAAAYGHEAWTLPSHRGRSLRRLTYLAELLAARRAGKRWLVAYQLKQETLDAMLVNLARTGVPRGAIIDVIHVVHAAGRRLTWRQTPQPAHEAAMFVPVSGARGRQPRPAWRRSEARP
jgi:hypothetical protein